MASAKEASAEQAGSRSPRRVALERRRDPAASYRLPDLLEQIAAGHPVVIVEGERKADLLWSWKIPATCCAGGAKKWRAEHAASLRGASVVAVLPDNDDVGRQHAEAVAATLVEVGVAVRVVQLPIYRRRATSLIGKKKAARPQCSSISSRTRSRGRQIEIARPRSAKPSAAAPGAIIARP